MRLYSLQKRHVLFIFICFFTLFFISINIGLFSPTMLITISVKASNMTSPTVNYKVRRISREKEINCLKDKKFHFIWLLLIELIQKKSGPFKLETPQLGRFHQQLWITGQPLISGRKEEFTKKFLLSVHLHSSTSSSNPTALADAAAAPNNDQLHSEYHNRTRFLHCINEVSSS